MTLTPQLTVKVVSKILWNDRTQKDSSSSSSSRIVSDRVLPDLVPFLFTDCFEYFLALVPVLQVTEVDPGNNHA